MRDEFYVHLYVRGAGHSEEEQDAALERIQAVLAEHFTIVPAETYMLGSSIVVKIS